MEQDVQICDWTKGEVSPKLKGRTDYKGYYDAADTMLNMVTLPQGGATRRPGTELAGIAGNQLNVPRSTRLMPFQFSTQQAYMLEVDGSDFLGDIASCFQPYKDDGAIINTLTVSGAANNGINGNIRLTVNSTAGVYSDNVATVSGIVGTTEANGTWELLVIDSIHVDLQSSAFVNAYVSGGSVAVTVNVTWQFALQPPVAVTGAANNGSGLVRLTLSSLPGAWVGAGNPILITGVTGTVEANGNWQFTEIDSTHIDLIGSTFSNAYVSGGVAQGFVGGLILYLAADLPYLQYVQSNDTLFIFGGACPNGPYPPYALTRSSHTNWALTQVAFRDGPYLGLNQSATTLKASGTSGAITITASSTYGINPSPGNSGQGFLSTDIGRHVRIAGTSGQASGWAIITAIVSTVEVDAVVMPAVTSAAANGALGVLPTTSATTFWQLGKWCATTGYPQLGMFWQQRFVLLGTNNQPSAVELSVPSDFTAFQPTTPAASAADTVSAGNALSWIISSDEVDAVRWCSPAGSAVAMQFGIGTTSGEQIMQPATTTQALSSTNVQVYQETAYGAAPNVKALHIGKSVLFADVPGRKVHEWQWAWVVNGYLGPDRTVDAEHITRSNPSSLQGIVSWTWQQNPNGVIWAVLGDGSLIGFTYLPEQQIFAAHRHQLGGQYYGAAPFVEDVAVIPSPDQSYSELWLSVLRTIDGVPTRTIEVMTRFFDGAPIEDAWFVDCGLQSALGPTGTLAALPALTNMALNGKPPAWTGTGTLAATTAMFAGTNADIGSIIRVNGGAFMVTEPIDTEHVTVATLAPLTSTNASASFTVSTRQTSFSGLDYLNGETVRVLGDGANFGTVTVANGSVAVGYKGATFATIGLPYPYWLVSMPFEPLRAATSSVAKAKRIDHLFLRVFESLDFKYGQRRTDPTTRVADDDAMDAFESRTAGDNLGQGPPLFTGAQRLPFPGGYDYEGQVIVGNDGGPFPLTVLSIAARAEVGDDPEGPS